MSLMIVAFFLLTCLIGLVASVAAIAVPQIRMVAGIVAIFGFALAGAAIWLFVFIVSQMA